MATVEVIVTIRVDPEGNGMGISDSGETLVDECCYYGGALDSALCGALEVLQAAYNLVDERADAAHPAFAAKGVE